jgi:hypothetical protein
MTFKTFSLSTSRTMYNTADFATSSAWAVSPVRQSKKDDLQNFPTNYYVWEYTGLNRKFLRFSNEKSIIFFKYIYTIFNQLYNFHCLLLPSPNVSQAFQFRSCKNFMVLIQNMLG